jgi:hypothetical protein
MKARSFQSLILTWSVLAGAGCHHDLSPRDSLPSAVAEPCSPAPQLPLVFYDETGAPSKIAPAFSELELKRIVDAVAAQTKDSIWLIRIKPPVTVEAYATAIIYLAPQRQTQRIRTGYAHHADVFREKIGIYPRWRYIQVSKVDQTFTEQLTLPSAGDLAFAWPTIDDPNRETGSSIHEDEVIRIADFVRQPLNYGWMLNGRMVPVRAETFGELPILWIREHDKTIEVELGYQHGGLWGHGRHVILERTSTGYKVVEWGMWMS